MRLGGLPARPDDAERHHTAVRFLLGSLHRADYRRQVEAAGIPLDHAPDVVDVRCPRCDALCVADPAHDAEPWDLEAQEWAATVRLDGECPDHAHAFAVP